MLADGEPFSFSRFGDGEFNAIFGEEGENCDGHAYFPDMGRELAGILERKPGYLLGLQPLAVMIHGWEPILSVSDGIRWTLADCLQSALLEGRLAELFDALAPRRVVLVGPAQLGGLADARGWDHHAIPLRNCWLQRDAVAARLRAALPESDVAVLFCASMMSNVLIDDLHASRPANTYVDVGCVFDPCVGVNSRVYHAELDPAVLDGIRA